MRKPTMKAPVKKGSKRVKRFEDGGYTGDDEIVKYRMGQIKDPGVDLFKLVRGEEQVAKPIPLDKKPETKAEVKAEEAAEVTPVKEDSKTYSYPDSSLIKEPPIAGGKGKGPVKVEKTTVTKIEPNKKPAPITNKDVDRLREIDKPLEKVTPEEYLMPGGALKGLAAISSKLFARQAANAADKAFRGARDITPGVKQIGMDAKRIGMDARKQIGLDKKQISYNKPTGSRNTSTSKEFKRGADDQLYPFKKGGSIKKMSSGGGVKSASARADGCAIRGKTRA
jgi:hypothetical protein